MSQLQVLVYFPVKENLVTAVVSLPAAFPSQTLSSSASHVSLRAVASGY